MQISSTFPGHGHSIHTLLEYQDQTGESPKNLLDRYILDENNQMGTLGAIIMEETSHSVWANSKVSNIHTKNKQKCRMTHQNDCHVSRKGFMHTEKKTNLYQVYENRYSSLLL